MKNSRRQDAATLYADIDGFTAYVAKNIASDDNAKHIVRTLNILRSELDAVLHEDFGGRKVRLSGTAYMASSWRGPHRRPMKRRQSAI